jgi:hypothetical protein
VPLRCGMRRRRTLALVTDAGAPRALSTAGARAPRPAHRVTVAAPKQRLYRREVKQRAAARAAGCAGGARCWRLAAGRARETADAGAGR